MADVFSEAQRSAIMKKVHSSGNKSTELKLIKIFRANGIKGWRRNYDVKGHPDFVFLNQHIAIFTDGCFWHGHNCRNTTPSSNKEYWQAKIDRNKAHDAEITAIFIARGWQVIRIWECELTRKKEKLLLEKLSPLLP